MSNGEDVQGLRKLLGFCLGASIILMLLHYYYYCQPAVGRIHFGEQEAEVQGGDYQQLIRDILVRLLGNIRATGLFSNPYNSKLFALLCLGIFLLGVRGRKDERITYRPSLILMGVGIILLFLLTPPASPDAALFLYWGYIVLTAVGFLLILSGGIRLSRVLHSSLRNDDPFGRLQAGFPQEERRIKGDFSINLPASYTWRGKERKSFVNIINPRRGILIMGSPGSGKSWFIIEPIMRQMIEKGFAIFLYDYKYPQLTRLAYGFYLQHPGSYPASAKFYTINFTDLSRSHRCNVIDPRTMDWLADAIGASRTILLSMNKTWVNRQGEFFVESPINYLAAIIWFLRKYQGGKYCTLPHAIELAQVPYEKLFTVLATEPEIGTLINPFMEAFTNKSMEMLDGQVASARIPLGRLSSPELYYILSGNDCTLEINDPAAPMILSLGGDPPRQEALAPILSLYIDRLNKLVNRPGRHRTALICDEFATVRAASMMTTVATARSNDIVAVMAVQDLSQLRTRYSRDEADLILNIAGNLLCGQVSGETARWVSERFPRILQDRTSISTNSSDTSVSVSRQWESPVTPATISTLSSGEFLGVVADDPGERIELKAFHANLLREDMDGGGVVEIPLIRKVDQEVVMKNFQRIRLDILCLIGEVLGQVTSD